MRIARRRSVPSRRWRALAGCGLAAVLTAAAPALAAPAFAAPTASASRPAALPTSTPGVVPASLPPAAPVPTSTEHSPAAPDPTPPQGGIGPDGGVVGGPRLIARGNVVPAGAPRLPAHITAKAWMLTDLDTGEVLAARDPHGRYQPASVLKTLTSLVLLPQLPGNRVITASAAAANAEGSAVGLVAGGRYTVDTLFKSLLLMSGNDAATALAQAAGGVSATVAEMNAEARALGAWDTYVQTPSGLDGWKQLTSAYDLSLVMRAVAADPRFVAYERAPTAVLPKQKVGTRSWGSVPLYNQSEDFLTGVKGALFAKTGYTDAAQHTYLCAAERGGRRLGVVLLRAQRAPLDQWQQAAELLDWGYALPTSTPAVGLLVSPRTASSSPARTAPATAAPTTAAPTTTAQRSGAPESVAAATSESMTPTAMHPSGAATGRSAWPPLAGLVAVAIAFAAVLRKRRRIIGRR